LLSGITRTDTDLTSSPSNGSESLSSVGRMAGLFQAGSRRRRSNPSGKFSHERWTRGTVTSTIRRAAHPPGCARCGAGAGCSAIKYRSPVNPSKRGRRGVHPTRPDPHPAFASPGFFPTSPASWTPLLKSGPKKRDRQNSFLSKKIFDQGKWPK